MASNKLRLAEGVTRSADGILVDFKQLTVDPGWNVRARTPELEAHIESIKDDTCLEIGREGPADDPT